MPMVTLSHICDFCFQCYTSTRLQVVTTEKDPASPPGTALKDPILAAAYGDTVMKSKQKQYSVKELLKKLKQMVECDDC